MEYLQGLEPLQFEKKSAHGILTGVLKRNQSKGTSMQFYWLHDRSPEQKKTLHTGNSENTNYDTTQQKTIQINIIELSPPSM